MEAMEEALIISVIQTGPRERHREAAKEPRAHGGLGNMEEEMEPKEGTDSLAKVDNQVELVVAVLINIVMTYSEETQKNILVKEEMVEMAETVVTELAGVLVD